MAITTNNALKTLPFVSMDCPTLTCISPYLNASPVAGGDFEAMM
jgi:hypothetical protein